LVDITGGLLSALSLVGGSMVLMKKRKTFIEKIHQVFEREIKENLRREFEKLVSRRVDETIGVLQKLLQDRIILAEGQIRQLEQLKEQLNKNLAELEKLVVS
jgi:phosphatidylserine decarboxylase